MKSEEQIESGVPSGIVSDGAPPTGVGDSGGLSREYLGTGKRRGQHNIRQLRAVTRYHNAMIK
jgi:hypothetical protein